MLLLYLSGLETGLALTNFAMGNLFFGGLWTVLAWVLFMVGRKEIQDGHNRR